MIDTDASDLKKMRAEIAQLNQRLNEFEARSWLLSGSLWRRVLAVMGHIFVGYIVIIIVGAILGTVLTALAQH